MKLWYLLTSLLILASAPRWVAAQEGITPNGARSRVREGMTGYGLSVFKGTRIDRFEVKVVSVLKNFNPKYDVVLIECKGANLEHTGAIAGMSGSPIYLKDDQGRVTLSTSR